MEKLCLLGLVVGGALVLRCAGEGGTEPTTTTTTLMPGPSDRTPLPGLYTGTPPSDRVFDTPTTEEYAAALETLNIDNVKADIVKAMAESQEQWPADFGNYGPFFVRLAWHCSGSYRKTDGKGGCAGGRQRFEPEASWADNTNLDKARALLVPIKEKYGHALSWGDLFTLAGTTAMRQGGTPIKQWCAGRIDSPDGTLSLDLGPTPEQEKEAPCDNVNGKCFSGKTLGSTTVGLIYLNPEGPIDDNGNPQPDPALSAKEVRESFERMDHNDRDTVALIGGGHSFGKSHGACPNGAGYPPKVVYESMMPNQIPWPGLCGDGKGNNTYTAGFEGPWTTDPLSWDSEFFKLLLDRTWEKWMGPADKWQWRITKPANNKEKGLLRLTSDMALMFDDKYLAIVKEFAQNMTAFNVAFDEAWTKLTMKGGEWSTARRCDAGTFPEYILDHNGMKSSDVVV